MVLLQTYTIPLFKRSLSIPADQSFRSSTESNISSRLSSSPNLSDKHLSIVWFFEKLWNFSLSHSPGAISVIFPIST